MSMPIAEVRTDAEGAVYPTIVALDNTLIESSSIEMSIPAKPALIGLKFRISRSVYVIDPQFSCEKQRKSHRVLGSYSARSI